MIGSLPLASVGGSGLGIVPGRKGYKMKTYVMRNFGAGKTVRKTQRTQPRMAGWTCVSIEAATSSNARGQQRFNGASGSYCATVMRDGSHYQP